MFKRVLFIASLLFCISFSVKAATLQAYIKSFQTTNDCTYQIFTFTDSSIYTGTHKGSDRDKWYFSDGATDTGTSVTRYFSATGTYTISLVVTNATDDIKDSTSKTVTITGIGVLPALSYSGALCARSEPTFVITSGSANVTYSTNWEDGSLAQSDTDLGVHTFLTAGTYNVVVSDVTTAGCKSSITVPITIGQRPVARVPIISGQLNSGETGHCQDSSTTFTATQQSVSDTLGMHVTYLWKFQADNSTYTGKTVTKLFTVPGYPTVVLVVINHTGSCSDSTSPTQFPVYGNPIVNFGMVPHCQDSLGIIYDSTSIPYSAQDHPISWTWNFCDSNHSNCDTAAGYTGFYTPASFNYGFPHGGTFYVTEYVVSGDGCRDSLQKKVYVSPTPTPDFVFRNTCQDSAVQFTDASTVPAGNSVVAWNWNFGDTSITKMESNLQDPAHSYNRPGYNYSVRLIAKTQAGCIDSVRHNVVVYPLPQANFVFISKCQGVQVPFTNTSSIDTTHDDALSHYVWIYGDGTPNDTVINPFHTFSDSGYHNVKLVAFSVHGCSDTITQPVYVYPLPKPSFLLPDKCERDSITFINTSTSTFGLLNDTSYSWNFGDTTATATIITSPKHVYFYPDTFNVTLTAVTRVYQCSKDTVVKVIVTPGPIASFTVGAKCTGAPVQFINTTTSIHPGVITYFWEFGDGTTDTATNPVHTFNSTAGYRVRLTAYMPGTGCIDSTSLEFESITPRPVVFFRANNACSDSFVTCTDSSYVPGFARPTELQSWSWDFGDGHFASGATVTHKYASPGVYTIREYVISSSDCEDSFIRQVTIYSVPVSNFSYVESCAGTPTPFTSLITAADSVVSWNWVFSSNTNDTDTSINTTHIYQDNDILNAALTVATANGCPDTKTIGVSIYTSPVSDFNYTLNCNDRPLSFYAVVNDIVQPPNYITSYHWNFDDTAAADQIQAMGQAINDTSDIQNPSPITFTYPGNYSVTLTETSNQGCVDVDTQVIEIPVLPIAGFIATGNCVGKQFEFADTSKPTGGFGIWNLGDNNAVYNSSPISHTYAKPGTYLVKMYEQIQYTIGSNPVLFCYSDTAETNVVVNPLPTAKFSADTACFGTPTVFYDSSSANGGVIASYSWKFGDGTIDSVTGSPFYHTFADSFKGADSIYATVLKVTTNFGCDSSDTQKVFVRQIPYASFSANPNPAAIQNPQVTFTNTTLHADPSHYYWTFGDSTNSHEVSPTHTYKDTGTYLVTLATDNDFCVDTFRYIVYVTPGYTLYAPNCITVNGDGLNDVWMAKGVGVVDFDVVIVDRWGQQVFHSTDINQPWNADYNGNGVKVPEGAYVYYIKASDFSGTNFTDLKGNITVLR